MATKKVPAKKDPVKKTAAAPAPTHDASTNRLIGYFRERRGASEGI